MIPLRFSPALCRPRGRPITAPCYADRRSDPLSETLQPATRAIGDGRVIHRHLHAVVGRSCGGSRGVHAPAQALYQLPDRHYANAKAATMTDRGGICTPPTLALEPARVSARAGAVSPV